MVEFKSLYQQLEQHRMSAWVPRLQQSIDEVFATRKHGKWDEWQELSQTLPDITPSIVDFENDLITVGQNSDLTKTEHKTLTNILQQFHPWRKGPYQLFDTHIDTEWHSDWKWQRLEKHIAPLTNRRVLDVGCGNGYHAWRMLGAGAKFVIGADPSQFFLHQFNIVKHFAGKHLPIHLIPLKSEEILGLDKQRFDTVFSMGVLYHRRSPIDHLLELKQFIRPKGELILETLVIPGDINTVLVPEDRYAKMRNVWFIPSPALLCLWLQRAGFKNVRVADLNQTSIEEQRSTPWMTFESLPDFLNPDNANLTIEGYPAPTRAVVICNAP